MSGYLHMAETRKVYGRTCDGVWEAWEALCRCGWSARSLSSQADARAAGDAHLADANGAGK